MSTVSMGAGIEPVDMPTIPTPDPGPVEMPAVDTPGAGVDIDQIKAEIRAEMRGEMNFAIADIERRLAQAREIEHANGTGVRRETVHAEDLNVGFAMIDGYNLTANSPTPGKIAWASLHVVLLGVDYTIADGNTDKKYAWFVKPATYTAGTQVQLQFGDAMPTLGSGDALIFINNGGVPVSVLESSVVYAVAPGAIGAAQLDSSTQTLLSNLQANDIALQAAIDGSISSYYQPEAPWPAGSPSPAGGNVNQGDIWYDSDNGWTYRWTGAGGTPANTWFRIADTDIALVQNKLNTRTTTYLSVLATPPVAPTGGFTVGDFWMVTDQGNLIKRWSGTAWENVLIGDAAIASGISGAKIGTGIKGENITTGTVAAARVGAGVNGALLTTATGQVGSGQIASNAVTPNKINAAFHILY